MLSENLHFGKQVDRTRNVNEKKTGRPEKNNNEG